MTYDEIRTAWNAQADEHNQWDNLGEDEKIEWAVKCAFPARVELPPPLAPDHKGMHMHYKGLLRQVENALVLGEREPMHADFLRQLCGHLKELGERYYAGDMTVVDEFLQLYCIEEEARASLAATPAAGELAALQARLQAAAPRRGATEKAAASHEPPQTPAPRQACAYP